MNIQIKKEVLSDEAVIKAGKWTLRPYKSDDSDIIYAAGTDPTITYFMGKEPLASREAAADLVNVMIRRMRDKTGIAWVIIDNKTQKKMGHMGLWTIDEANCRAELGYALLSPYQRIGVMSAVLPAVLKFAFRRLRLHSVCANTSDDNEGSQRLLEKNGFALEARFRENHLYRGRYIDSLIYCKLESDHSLD